MSVFSRVKAFAGAAALSTAALAAPSNTEAATIVTFNGTVTNANGTQRVVNGDGMVLTLTAASAVIDQDPNPNHFVFTGLVGRFDLNSASTPANSRTISGSGRIEFYTTPGLNSVNSATTFSGNGNDVGGFNFASSAQVFTGNEQTYDDLIRSLRDFASTKFNQLSSAAAYYPVNGGAAFGEATSISAVVPAIPEPNMAVAAAAGGAGLLALRRRRRTEEPAAPEPVGP